jgi:dimethylhistidine N-methyltransferase
MRESADAALLDLEPTRDFFMNDVLAGLRDRPRHLPCKYFYDARGSRLFDEICALDEYYLTRAELAIMRRHTPEMADQIGPGAVLVEYGSGSSIKTRLLLKHLSNPAAYVPVDISRKHLSQTATRLGTSFPHIEVLPVCADFTEPFELPVSREKPTHSAVYFPGSTIGNYSPDGACALLGKIAPLCGTGGGLLIGIDLQKDVETIEAAYNDKRGVTADFNLNLLKRINRELGGNFDLSNFKHRARYNQELDRVEIFLVSQADQVVSLNGEPFQFNEREAICTEYSHKYTIDGFAVMAADVGLKLRRVWTGERAFFGVLHFTIDE